MRITRTRWSIEMCNTYSQILRQPIIRSEATEVFEEIGAEYEIVGGRLA